MNGNPFSDLIVVASAHARSQKPATVSVVEALGSDEDDGVYIHILNYFAANLSQHLPSLADWLDSFGGSPGVEIFLVITDPTEAQFSPLACDDVISFLQRELEGAFQIRQVDDSDETYVQAWLKLKGQLDIDDSFSLLVIGAKPLSPPQ